jgi:hypothetical protein
MLKFPVSWSSFRFQIENHRVNPFVSLHHGIDRKVLLDTIATGTTIDFRNSSEGPNCFSETGASNLYLNPKHLFGSINRVVWASALALEETDSDRGI